MDDVITPFFEHLSTTYRYFPSLVDIVGSCRFNIEGADSWTITITNGVPTITKNIGDKSNAESVVTGSKEDFARMIQKQQHPLTAFLQGRLKIDGDLGLAETCMRAFRLPEENIYQQTQKGPVQ